MTFTILFATGENTRTGICYASNEMQAKQKLFNQYPNATCIKIHKGMLCFEAETIDGIKEEYK